MAKSVSKSVGRPANASVANNATLDLICSTCGRILPKSKFHETESEIFSGSRHFPICDGCIKTLSEQFKEKYSNDIFGDAESKAIKRLCMLLDIYYNENIVKSSKRYDKYNFMIAYLRELSNFTEYRDFTYEETIMEERSQAMITVASATIQVEGEEIQGVSPKTVKFFGTGFSDDDYMYLQEQYDDWTTRHECKTKAQEEVFKRLCFKQLEILKATRKNEDTKDLDTTFQKLLETAKLQPKQNSSDTMSDVQTFGTLIDKWENTRPLPEIDESLKDVDKIGLYIDVFFRGHLSKMMGIKNAFSNLYTKFIKKYTVDKPEYNEDDNSEIIFDAIFGGGYQPPDEK